MGDILKDVVLVVDDESAVCRAIKKMLAGRVCEVLSAFNPAEAELILESREVTMLVCDYRFGSNQDVGLRLVTKWREKYPSIRRAVLLTGTDTSLLSASKGVDRIISKSIQTKELLEALGLV